MSDQDFMNAEVRVFCPICKNGKNTIWHGCLIDWAIELSKNAKSSKDIPEWYKYAVRHERAHGHKIMVKYPDKTVPLRF